MKSRIIREIIAKDLAEVVGTIAAVLTIGLLLGGPATLAERTGNNWYYIIYLVIFLIGYGISVLFRWNDYS